MPVKKRKNEFTDYDPITSAVPVYVVVASGAVIVSTVVLVENAGSVEFPTATVGALA